MRRLLITGSRDWTDRELMWGVLREYLDRFGPALLVHGDQRGADRMAAEIWESFGYPVKPYPAQWKQFGKKAGGIRNDEMVSDGASDCLAFPGPNSIGTWDCVRKAKKARIHTLIFFSSKET